MQDRPAHSAREDRRGRRETEAQQRIRRKRREGKGQTLVGKQPQEAGGCRQSGGGKANEKKENKSTPRQKHRRLEAEGRSRRGLVWGPSHTGRAASAQPRSPHHWEVGAASPGRAASVKEKAHWSGWGLGLRVPSVQPGCHGHGYKERG